MRLKALAGILLAVPLVANTKKRIDDATIVLSEILAAPDRSIPRDLLDKSRCIVVVPGFKKGAFIFGGEYGKGFFVCRNRSNVGWSSPASIRIEGGSFGLQVGGSETDVVMLVMNQRGANKLLSSRFTIGGEGQAAAGPVGRSITAQTDALFHAEILSWSRSRGIFAGISLTGATLRQDLDDNEDLYGTRFTNRQIVNSNIRTPVAASELVAFLNKNAASPRNTARR